MKIVFVSSAVFVFIASACATGGGSSGDDGGKKDSGIILAKDSGSGGKDTGANLDTGTGKDTGTGTCQDAPPSNVCGVYPQCDCSGSQTCEVDQTALNGSSSCVPAGNKPIGGACTATASQCAAGLTCIWGQCHAYCGTDGAACTNPNTNACVNLTDSNTNPIPNLLICHNDCELADPNSCGGGGEGCIYFDVDKVDCYPVGTTTASCNATTSICPAGQVCLTDQTSYFCLPWCRVGQNDCKSGTCNDLAGPTVNGVTYGYCQ